MTHPQLNMLKRPMTDDVEGASDLKKPRLSAIQNMKARMDALLKKAEEHHESARIAAIDKASALEEELNDAREERDKTQKELDTIQKEYSETCAYLETVQNSQTVKMLQNASGDTSSDIETLSKDNEEVQSLMKELCQMKNTLSSQIENTQSELADMQERCTVLEEDHHAAEENVDKITKLSEK